MLTYVYGVVPMSLCRNGWCRPQGEPPESHNIQLEDLANYLLFSHVVSDHWTGQGNPTLNDTSVQEVRVSVQEVGVLPSTSSITQQINTDEASDEATKRHGYPLQDSQSDCEVVIVPDSKLTDQEDVPLRDGTNFEVRVEIETQPRGARQSSLSSILSVESSGRAHSQSQNNLCASEAEESQKREEEARPEGAAEGTFLPVFETETV